MVPLLLPYAGLASLSLLQVASMRRQQGEQQRLARQQADLLRTARLTATELRHTALGLLGQAETLPEASRRFLLSTEANLLALAETLLAHTDAPDTPRQLSDDDVALDMMIDFAVAQISSWLAPGRRSWHIAEEVRRTVLFADRRAVHQILQRVLANAAFASGEGGWIALSCRQDDEGWSLLIEDEGNGISVAGVAGAGRDSRGLGIGLALARDLMQAHGGALHIESAANVGTRARLVFPAVRLLSKA